MRKELGDEQIRVSARLPQPFYDELCALMRARYGWWGSGHMSLLIRYALMHYLTCPDLVAAVDEHAVYQDWLATRQKPSTA